MTIQEIKANLPDTQDREPDNAYFDHTAFSWNGVVVDDDGQSHKARLGYLTEGFQEDFPADKGGELITLIDPVEGDELRVDILDQDGEIATTKVLAERGDNIFVEEGKMLRATTPASLVNRYVEYVCEYPGQPSEQ